MHFSFAVRHQTGNRQSARRTEDSDERENQTQHPENPPQHGHPRENQAQQCKHEAGRSDSVQFLFGGLVDDNRLALHFLALRLLYLFFHNHYDILAARTSAAVLH